MLQIKSVIKSFIFVFIIFITLCCCACASSNDGKSAYEIAVEHGFCGTEEEWLESLKGKDADNVGISAYDIALNSGLVSNEEEWLQYLLRTASDSSNNEEIMKVATNVAMKSSVKVIATNGSETDNGTGVIVDYDLINERVYIITCYHVIVNPYNEATFVSDNIYIQFYGIEDSTLKFSASCVGGNPYSDIAILSLSFSNDNWNKYNLKVSTIAGIRENGELNNYINLGESVIAIGNSKNKGLNAVRGSISKVSELTSVPNVNGISGNSKFRVMRFDAIIQTGNSGGGLFNSSGELIGIVNAKSTYSDETNFAYAIPIQTAYAIFVNVKRQLSDTTSFSFVTKYKCGLSFSIGDVQISEDNNNLCINQDVVICSVSSLFSDAKKGDIVKYAILQTGEKTYKKEITNIYELAELLWYADYGSKLTLNVKRNNNIYEISTNLTQIVDLYSIREDLASA